MNTAQAEADPRQDWQSQPLGAVIAFILTRFHEPLRRDLPDLVKRARQIEDGPGKYRPVGLANHLEQIRL